MGTRWLDVALVEGQQVMSDLNWQLRGYLHELRDDGRLFILLSIYLHRNIRNRSWPNYDTIQAETGYARYLGS